MEHFYQNIQGWTDGIDTLYHDIVQGMAEDRSRQYHIVEVGSWRGRSSACMAVELIRAGVTAQFDCVDTWQGQLDADLHQQDPAVVEGTLYQEFVNNMRPAEGHYRALRMTSVEAAALYPDQSLDFVFIDADHNYEAVRSDILAWWPKVRVGGVLAGHDYYEEASNGVGRAVRELFAHTGFEQPAFCWQVRRRPGAALAL